MKESSSPQRQMTLVGTQVQTEMPRDARKPRITKKEQRERILRETLPAQWISGQYGQS